MKLKPLTVLMTGAGAPGAPGIIKSLRLVKERKIKIIGVDVNSDAVGFAMVDKHHQIPRGRNKHFIPKLLNIAKREKVDVILPLVTNELEQLAKGVDKFEKAGIKVGISPLLGLRIANNKHLLMDLAENLGIPVPRFFIAKTQNEMNKAIKKLGYPKKNVCIKPPVSNGMRGFRILTEKVNMADLLLNQKPTGIYTTLRELKLVLQQARRFPPLLVMEYLPGREYSVDVLAKDGNALIVVPRERLVLKNGISFIGMVVNNKKIINATEKLVRSLKLNGCVGFQFKEDSRGVPKLIESNPRLQGTIVLTTAANANLVYLNVKMLLGEKVKSPGIKWGTKMVRYWEEIYYDRGGRSFKI